MTTADIAFAQPGNPDRLRDYQQNARTIFWALLAAILIHLLVALLLAAFSGFFSPALPAPEKPVELTFMDLSPASMASKNSAFIETDESKNAPEPKDKTFEASLLPLANCRCRRRQGKTARLWISKQILIHSKQRAHSRSRTPHRNRMLSLLRNQPLRSLPRSNLRY